MKPLRGIYKQNRPLHIGNVSMVCLHRCVILLRCICFSYIIGRDKQMFLHNLVQVGNISSEKAWNFRESRISLRLLVGIRLSIESYMIICNSEPVHTLTLSQCTLAGPVYTVMPLECHWLTQCTLGYHWPTQWILAGYTGTSLERLSSNSHTLECHWRNLVETAPHWDATGETLTFATCTETPLEGMWQPTHARHI